MMIERITPTRVARSAFIAALAPKPAPQALAAEPQNYRRLETASTSRILAYGRDPYFAGWPDTLQLNYGNPALQDALLGELQRIARRRLLYDRRPETCRRGQGETVGD